MRVWFTADLHLGHGNIIKYCQRPFLSPEEKERAVREPGGVSLPVALRDTDPRGASPPGALRDTHWKVSAETVRRHDDGLLDAINAAVAADDVLWILGDFCLGKLHEATRYRERIRCRNVHFVWGNHDHRSIRPLFGEAIEQGMIEVEGQEIWLNHYPMRSWNKAFHGSWHLYGHVHGRLVAEDDANGATLTRDVGVDACGYRPWSFEELRGYMQPRVEKFRRQAESRRQ